MIDNRIKHVAFVDVELLEAFNKLKSGRFEDKELVLEIDSAMNILKLDPLAGTKIERKLWPKEYIRKYNIDNLRKYDMRNGWRLTYYLVGSRIEIVSVVLEWFDHKNYEKRFGYKIR